MNDQQGIYTALYRIRRFEETVLEHFSEGVFFGTTHTCIGQEANAVGVLKNLGEDDIVFSNHRCHGHFLAYGGSARGLFAELMGKSTGVCGGRGGSQHLQWRNFYSNGIQGGIVPIATGMGFAEKLKKSHNLVVVFLGDGTLGQGVVYESLNMASLWDVPILYVLENNRIAQTTPIDAAVAGNMRMRFKAFDIPVVELDTSDVILIQSASKELMGQIRINQTPQALILNTYRFGPHSKGDDTRPQDELRRYKENFDPLSIHSQRLALKDRQNLEAVVDQEIQSAYEMALDDPFPELEIS